MASIPFLSALGGLGTGVGQALQTLEALRLAHSQQALAEQTEKAREAYQTGQLDVQKQGLTQQQLETEQARRAALGIYTPMDELTQEQSPQANTPGIAGSMGGVPLFGAPSANQSYEGERANAMKQWMQGFSNWEANKGSFPSPIVTSRGEIITGPPQLLNAPVWATRGSEAAYIHSNNPTSDPLVKLYTTMLGLKTGLAGRLGTSPLGVLGSQNPDLTSLSTNLDAGIAGLGAELTQRYPGLNLGGLAGGTGADGAGAGGPTKVPAPNPGEDSQAYANRLLNSGVNPAMASAALDQYFPRNKPGNR